MVSNTLEMGFRCGVLTFLIKRSGCLDAYIKRDDRKYCLFCQMGQGRQPQGPARCHHDRLRPGTD
jgi:hypothetical protein